MTTTAQSAADPFDGKRPNVAYKFGPVAQVLHWGSLISGILLSVALLVRYPALPELVPVHFSFSGEPDLYGPRNSVFLLVAVFFVLTIVVFFLTTRPRWFNYPVPVTQENAAALYSNGATMMAWVAASMQLVYAGITLFYFGIASNVLLIVGLVAMLVISLIGVVRMFRLG